VQYLEEQMENTKSVVTELVSQLEATKSQLSEARAQIRSLEWQVRQQHSPDPPGHSTPTTNNGCHALDVQLSDISDTTCPRPKSRKNVNFAQTKSVSEGNLLQLKRRAQADLPSLRDQSCFRHSITFGEDSFLYSGFLDVEFHSNVTRKMKERKRKTKAGKKLKQQNSAHEMKNKETDKRVRTQKKTEHEKEKRDSGIIGDSCTESD
jgi:hypothetical protein